MQTVQRWWTWCGLAGMLLSGLIVGPGALGDDPPSVATESASEEQIAQWIADLDAAEFSQRQDATIALRRQGPAVFPQLVEAAQGTSRERSARAVQIIEFHYRNGSDQAKQQAKQALETIAQKASPRIARRAASILRPTPPPQANPGAPARAAQQAAILRLRAMRAAALRNGARTVTISNVNGVKTITIREKDRTVKLVESPQDGITLTVTQTKNGKQEVKIYKAKNADELKKKDKQAYEVYQEAKKEDKGVGQIQIQLGVIPGAIPVQPARPQRAAVGRELKDAVKKLEQSIETLEKLKPEDREGREKAIRELREIKERLQQLGG